MWSGISRSKQGGSCISTCSQQKVSQVGDGVTTSHSSAGPVSMVASAKRAYLLAWRSRRNVPSMPRVSADTKPPGTRAIGPAMS